MFLYVLDKYKATEKQLSTAKKRNNVATAKKLGSAQKEIMTKTREIQMLKQRLKIQTDKAAVEKRKLCRESDDLRKQRNKLLADNKDKNKKNKNGLNNRNSSKESKPQEKRNLSQQPKIIVKEKYVLKQYWNSVTKLRKNRKAEIAGSNRSAKYTTQIRVEFSWLLLWAILRNFALKCVDAACLI